MRSTSWEFQSTRMMKQTRLPDLSRHFSTTTSLSSKRRYSDFGLQTSSTINGTMDPPACVQNAMMKQDKKPFTYTPGGIDLSEVRSPRMQRRIERNANLAGAGDNPRPNPHPQSTGPLPPSALAAMRPQTQVQVFPQAPPPPPMKNIPPPPPPPSCPLPTTKVTTTDNQVLERPDMTKIIPENPMALLRKTGGPAPRPSMIDAVYQEHRGPPSPPQKYQPPVVDRPTLASPPTKQNQPSYQPPPPQRQFEAQSPRWQPQQQTSASVQQQFQSPPQRDFEGQSPKWPQTQQQSPPVQQQQHQRPLSQSFDTPKPSYQPPVIERQPTISRQNEQPTKANSNVGSLYIPPIHQQQSQRVVSPPTPPQREPQIQSPGTPTLREAPRPWQAKSGQQQELPPWARKEDNIENNQLPSQMQSQQSARSPQPTQAQYSPMSPPTQHQQQQQQGGYPRAPQPSQSQYSPRTPPTQKQQQGQQGHPGGFPIHIEIRAVPYPAESQEPEERKPNAVYVSQPLVLQHPGPGGVKVVTPPVQQKSAQPAQNQSRQNNVYQQSKHTTSKQESTSTRIIPIQIERTPPSTPNERSLNRQLSWGQNPTQSNKFKVIQKITQTDDDVDDDTPITQHSARFTQEMPEQFKGMKISNGDRFKQGIKTIDEENPRYRGGHIPSRIFKMLDESVPQQYPGSGGNNMNSTAPVNEGNGQPQKYVHPSEQTVPEPKKYMGGNIPSRSFKILQAMTAPDNSANVNNNEDLTYNQYPYTPHPYPVYFPPPYWQEHFSNYYPCEEPESSKFVENNSKNLRPTPLPARTITPLPSGRLTPQPTGRTTPGLMGRTTPLPIPPPPPMYPPPFWGYQPPNFQNNSTNPDSKSEIMPCSSTDSIAQNNMYPSNYPMYHPYYFDPYYYYYYHGYPPIPPTPYHYNTFAPDLESTMQSGYESAEELAKYNKKGLSKRRNSMDNSVQSMTHQFEVRCKSATPRISTTPTHQEFRPFFINQSKHNKKTDGMEEDEYEAKSVQDLKQKFESEKECTSTPSHPQFIHRDSEIEETDVLQEKHYETSSRENELCRLRSVKSVNNINLFHAKNDLSESDSSDNEESSDDEADEVHSSSEEDQEEIIPHQLSVIFEESERADSKARPCSAMTDASTINESSDEDNFNEAFSISPNLTVHMAQETGQMTNIAVENCLKRAIIVETETCTMLELKSGTHSSASRDIKNSFVNTEAQIQTCNEEDGETVYNIPCLVDNNHDAEQLDAEDIATPVVLRKKRGRQMLRSSNRDDSNESEKDFWNLLGKDKESPPHSRNNSAYYGYDDSPETTKTNSVIYKDSPTGTRTNSTVYDELKDTDSSSAGAENGRIMNVDSFVAKLEQIKRNSGLWDSDGIDFTIDSTKTNDENKNEELLSYKSEAAGGNPPNTSYKELEEAPCPNEITCLISDIEQMTTAINKCVVPIEETEQASENSDESIDFWSQIKEDDDDFQPRRKNFYEKNEPQTENITTTTAINSSSTSSRDSSSGKSSVSSEENVKQSNFIPSMEKSAQENQKFEQTQPNYPKILEEVVVTNPTDLRSTKDSSGTPEPQTIKERIEALKKSTTQKRLSQEITEELKVCVKNKISALETPNGTNNTSKTTSTKSSIKSFEEYSDEEVDSGVNSDLSRHISDNEEFPELKKLTRYERAATHSRLFKLLQDECDEEEVSSENECEKEDKFAKLSVRKREDNTLMPSRSKLNLPLTKCNETEESMEKPVNEKLADELVESILRRRKGHIFKNMPKEKIYAAAIKILQEDAESMGTPSEEFSSLLSPLRGDTESSTPAQTPQEFYNEYKQYYDSWNTEDDCDLIPSKAFKLLQEHINSSKLGTIEGFLAKCPKILTSKNIPKDVSEVSEKCDCYPNTFPTDQKSTNEVTNTS